MLGKQAVIEFLKKNNIDNIFHLPGIHTLPLNEELTKHNINVFIGRHEANIVFMADGYARTSGNVGVIIVTPGPGLGNTVSGCMEAYGDDIPLLIIYIDTKRKDAGKGVLHELAEPENIFIHFTKKTFIISNPGEIIVTLDNAYKNASSGRKGPVVVSLPYDLLEKEISSWPVIGDHGSENGSESKTKGEIDFDLNRLEEVLHGKKRPVIIGGKSLMFQEARILLDEMCTEASIPFFTSTGGKGIVREDSLYAFGNIIQKGLVRDMIASSDIVIAIGTRLRDADAKRRGVKIRELIHIDIDDRWINKNYPAKLKITGDIGQGLRALYQIIKGMKFEWNLPDMKRAKKKEYEAIKKTSPGIPLIELIRQVIPEDTTTVCDLNYPSYWAEYFFPVYQQRSFLMPRGISPIFYCLPASIGARIGRPQRPCLCLAGDGSLLPTIAELATIKKYNIPVVLFVQNNNSFGILEDIMAERYGTSGSMELKNPDFVKIAGAFDIRAKRVKTLEGLRKAFTKDIAWDKPFLIEFKSPVFPPPWDV
ncbi:MAG: thiamine pyrophosphate-binding protein [Proteobacteria bacterium]|nr:thiamine pyrophosphate-binding protein [Pseudomonadota bacterium]